MSVKDNEPKAGIFPGKMIIVDHGKIIALILAHLIFMEFTFQQY
jgi:hypothetical protein